MSTECPCCFSEKTQYLKNSDEYAYYKCENCSSLFIDPEYLKKIDSGFNIIKYDKNYWKMELENAWERSYGPSLARAAEAIYYCRRPINKFLDIGAGAGYLLDAIEKLIPGNAHIFYGVELFPPEPQFRTKSNNYIIGDLGELKDKYDCGVCIEVVEHLTPNMLKDIFKKLAYISNPGALYIFNTGMPDYVLKEDIDYLDPTHRGHLVSYSVQAIEFIAGQYGFNTHRIPGKTWAFAVEYAEKNSQGPEDIRERVWTALEHNLNILTDRHMGSVLKILGLETSRAYN